jgi:hypothetical protein
MAAKFNMENFLQKNSRFFAKKIQDLMKCFNFSICYAPDTVTGVDWPYNEVGKIPRGPSSLGSPNAIPQHHDLFFFLNVLKFGNFLFGQRQWPLKKIPPTFGEPNRPCKVILKKIITSCQITKWKLKSGGFS